MERAEIRRPLAGHRVGARIEWRHGLRDHGRAGRQALSRVGLGDPALRTPMPDQVITGPLPAAYIGPFVRDGVGVEPPVAEDHVQFALLTDIDPRPPLIIAEIAETPGAAERAIA